MLTAALLAVTNQVSAVKVHTIGDSTMAEYEESRVTRGWGMYLAQFLSGIDVNNRGKAGSSTRSFYEGSAYWASVKSQLSEGDYVFIQFAHNDEKNSGADGDSLVAYYTAAGDETSASSTDRRGTYPSGSYKEYLRKYVQETRDAGCTPVLVAPICRMYFTSDGNIKRSGRHDLGDSFTTVDMTNGVVTGNKIATTDHTMDYPYQMKQVAEEMNVPFIDLTTATEELYKSYGDTKCHDLLSDGDGSTHLNTTGATLIARLCAQLMKENGVLADYVNLTSDLSISPSEADLGEAYVGQSLTKEFSLSGFSLTPASGTISITATDGLQLSTDQTDWSSSLSLGYEEGNIVQSFYAMCTLEQAGELTGTITVTQGDSTITIPVTAVGVKLEGGQEVLVYWRLEKSTDYVLTGVADVLGESWSNMKVNDYNKQTTWPENSGITASSYKCQRNITSTGKWPTAEIDEVYNRYIEFGVTASKNTTLKIDSIGMYVGGAGTNAMRCHVSYSTEPDFANATTFFSPSSMAGKQMYEASIQPVISLEEGDTLRVRIYPWMNNLSSEASGKTICLSDVSIHGYAMEKPTDGITTAVRPETAVRERYFSLEGRELPAARRGVNIVMREYADGSVRSNKVIY